MNQVDLIDPLVKTDADRARQLHRSSDWRNLRAISHVLERNRFAENDCAPVFLLSMILLENRLPLFPDRALTAITLRDPRRITRCAPDEPLPSRRWDFAQQTGSLRSRRSSEGRTSATGRKADDGTPQRHDPRVSRA